MNQSSLSASIDDILEATPVLPVVVLDREENAVPLARALLAGGVRVMEVTLRTACALDGIRAIVREVDGMTVGAGSILDPGDLRAARAAGAAFGVSPGATRELLNEARDWRFLPGVATPSEVMSAAAQGYTTLKLFPAQAAGGIPMLQALAGPFRKLRFCPTGGIDLASARAYLALPNVISVGGSWLTPPPLIERQDWAGITRLAAQAAALRR